MKIAVAGKGGVGKTTIAGTLARVLAERGRDVLAIDADSSPNLAFSLGIPFGEAERVTPVEGGLTEWRTNTEGEAYVHLHRPVGELIGTFGKPAPDGVRLLVMGEVLEASKGCRCSAHALARGITYHLIHEAEIVLLDLEAGLEHLGRGTAENVDLLLIVVEPYYRSLMTATRIQELAADLGIPRIAVVGNRVRGAEEQAAIERFCQNHNQDLLAVVPFDQTLLEAETAGIAPFDHDRGSAAVRAIETLADRLETHSA